MAMTEQEILAGLGEIIDEVAGVPADQVTPDKTFVDDLDIDSLSMVEIAVAAQKQLAERGIPARVVSVPSLELLLEQPAERREAVIGKAPVKVAIEAAVRWGWDAVIGQDGIFIGMHGFGESGPAKDLFKHFGITAEAVINAVQKRLG